MQYGRLLEHGRKYFLDKMLPWSLISTWSSIRKTRVVVYKKVCRRCACSTTSTKEQEEERGNTFLRRVCHTIPYIVVEVVVVVGGGGEQDLCANL